MQYTVYYWKDPKIILKVFLNRQVPTPGSLNTTHIKLGSFPAKDKEDLFRNMQAEFMPLETLNNVRAVNPSHTSMSVGDVVQEGSSYFIADVCGFTKIE